MEQLAAQGDLRRIQPDGAGDWEPFREAIIQLYWTEERKLPEVMETMKARHKFHATKKQYKARFKKWNLNKNVSHDKMKAIVRIQKRRRRNEDKGTEFSLHEKPVPQEKIDRWLKRQEPSEEEVASPNLSLTASTPSAIEYRTPASLVVSTPSAHSAEDPLSPGRAPGPLSALNLSHLEFNSLRTINNQLAPIIHGVVTCADRVFFDHYCYRLSAIVTLEWPKRNAFKDILLPMAVQHLGLMHSILAMSSTTIDYQEPYGKVLLAKYPDVTEEDLKERAQYHQGKSLTTFLKNIEWQIQGQTQENIVSILYAQMLCLVVQTRAEGRANGEHRIHLEAFQNMIREIPPDEGAFGHFIEEYFWFHIGLDDLISLPEGPGQLGAFEKDWSFYKFAFVNQPTVWLLGVQDGLFYYISQITTIRNTIRNNKQEGIDPVVDHASLYHALEVEACINDWQSLWPKGDLSRDLACNLYKHMVRVYLWRTISPPRAVIWQTGGRITSIVNEAIAVLKLLPPKDPIQTLLLAPTFIIGCAAFDPPQRQPIMDSLHNIKEWTNLKTADRIMEVLQEVWRYMDVQDERSWDWQMVAHEMGVHFLMS